MTPVQIGAASLFNKTVKTIAKIRTSKRPQQLEIWSLVRKRKNPKPTSQMEIWNRTTLKPKKAKIPDVFLKNLEKTKTAKATVDRTIKELSKSLATKLKHVDPRYPNDYLNREIVKVKANLRRWGVSKRMLSRLDGPAIDLGAITTRLNFGIQEIFKSENTKTFRKTLNTLNGLTEKCSSNRTSTLEKREAYLEIVRNVRNLHSYLYDTRVSRSKQITEFNRLLDSLFGK